MIDFVCIVFGVMAGLVAYAVLDAVLTTNIRFNRVGGLTHWRVGRYGGSFYRKAI